MGRGDKRGVGQRNEPGKLYNPYTSIHILLLSACTSSSLSAKKQTFQYRQHKSIITTSIAKSPKITSYKPNQLTKPLSRQTKAEKTII